MSSMSDSLAPGVDMGVESMQRQLFRYAQDLQELMHQQSTLEQHYKMLLKTLGRDVPANDLLSSTLIATSKLYVVTDPLGTVLRHSADADCEIGSPGHVLVGGHINALLSNTGSGGFGSVMARLAQREGTSGILQSRLELGHTSTGLGLGVFDVLAMQVPVSTALNEIYWLFQPATFPDSSDTEIQNSFINAHGSDVGLFVTTPWGDIRGVNAALTKATGFQSAEMLGQNPKMFGSGHHGHAFYQDFFMSLLDTGYWNGQILNRKKNGQIFLIWQSVKMVENAHGEIVSYISAVADLSLTEANASLSSPTAYRDPLSGLANRRTLDNHFNNVTRLERNQGATLWMLLLNLGEIVRLGDELGFAAADQARREVGGRLKSIERSELSTYDIGSGNFVALIQGDLNDAQVMKIARSALTLLETPMRLGQQLASVHAFIGCVSYPHDGKDLETLLKHAEIAMFGAKNFANPICFYEAEGSSDSPSVM